MSAGILALSPINVAVNRLNLPDPFMILFLVAAAWAAMKSLDSRRGLAWVLLAGLFVGLAFNTKMLAAYIPLPAIGARCGRRHSGVMVEAHRQGRLVRRICDRVLVAVDSDRRSVGQERAALYRR